MVLTQFVAVGAEVARQMAVIALERQAAASALAWNAGSLIAFRTLGAIEGAATGPASFAIISRIFPRAERVKALGYWSMVGAGAPVIGVVSKSKATSIKIYNGRTRYDQLWGVAEARSYYDLLKARYKAEILVPAVAAPTAQSGTPAAAASR